MKRLLLVMGIVGCGQTVDLSKLVDRGGLRYEINSETPFTGVAVYKHENGQKQEEATWKDGKLGSVKYWDEEGNERQGGF